MFLKDFYPTPPDVIEFMVNGNDITDKTILEPSAGNGNILDALKVLGANTIACEINEDLARISMSKADKFLKHDFMQVTREEISHINMIYMNPPFSADTKHILHAWEIAPDGCEIVALCNWESIDNRYDRHRSRLGTVIETYGFSSNLGSVFSNADRSTNVEVGIVRLFKPQTQGTFEDYFDYTPDEIEQQFSGIMPYNAVRDVVNRYVEACKLYDSVAENAVKMNHLIGEFVGQLAFVLKEDGKADSVLNFKIELQKSAWHWIFGKMNMGKYMTQSLKEELNKFTEQQQKVPFTMKNIYKMFEMVVATHGQRMSKVCIEVFEKLTNHYHENRFNLEGWKTNSHYLVNKKFILPYSMELKYMGGINIRHDQHLIDDLIKALDYLTGNRYSQEIRNSYSYSHDLKMQPNVWYDMAYFEIKGFKKGTLHAKFKDEKVWELFNRSVAGAKGFELPESI